MDYPVGTPLWIGELKTVVEWIGFDGNVVISRGATEWYITVSQKFHDEHPLTLHSDLLRILEGVKGSEK